jgi:hypothetical protein
MGARRIPTRTRPWLSLALIALVAAIVLVNFLRDGRSEPPAQPPPTPSQKTPEKIPVLLHILVIEADKKSDHLDKKVEQYKAAMPGFKGAKLLDELSATAEEGASVSLEIMRQNGKSRLLRVTVQDVTPDKTVKLRIAIDQMKFSADTTHKNGGTLVIHHPLSKDKALFLAVTPRVP